MPIEPRLVIGKEVFDVPRLTGMKTFTLQPLIAPPLIEVIGTIAPLLMSGKEFSIDAVDVLEIIPVLSKFFGKLTPADLEKITRELLNGATRDGHALFTENGDPFNVIMQGRTMVVWRLIWLSIQVNYPDFFGLLGAKGENAGAKVPAPSNSATSST